jgi:SAM-dependent methyltransferase
MSRNGVGVKSERELWSSLYRTSAFRLWLQNTANSVLESYYRFDLRRTLRSSVPLIPGKRLLEVGCAPGRYLVFFNHRFGLDVSGVDYSPEGCAQTRKTLRQAGVKAKVVCADFFDPRFLRRHADAYDYMFSSGFIEHFENSPKVLATQRSLLRPGGCIICLVPNLVGVNRALTERRIISIHNTRIMSLDAMRELVDRRDEVLFLDYIGGPFNLGLLFYKSKIIEYPRLALYALQRVLIDQPLKLLRFTGLRFRSCRSSPSILLVVRKAGAKRRHTKK